MTADIPHRVLGQTGESVSAIGIGGWHLGIKTVPEALAIRIVRTALDRGINFLDNSWDYNEGLSEVRMGRALRDGYRDKAFVMTKVDGRSRVEAARQLDESLRRFDIDYLDLVQHHEVIRFEDPHRMFDDDGAHRALTDAQRAGKVRYLGFTGHKDPAIHLHTLEVARRHGVRFDAVQLPLNVMDAHYRSFEKAVLPVLVQENIGVLGMKSMGSGVILQSRTVSAIECLHYTLNLPTSVVITGIDSMAYLDQACEAARTFRPLEPAAVAALLSRTAAAAATGEYEPFKISSIFDATAFNPSWLGEEAKRFRDIFA